MRDAAAAGCAGEIELLAQRQEVTDLLHLHGYRLPFAEDCKRHSPPTIGAEVLMAGPAPCLAWHRPIGWSLGEI